MKIADAQLYDSDKKILLDKTLWLSDSIITAAKTMLKNQTSVGGLQNPCLGKLCAFEMNLGEFIKILHNGHGHWLTVSTVGLPDGLFNIYDSLKSSVNKHVKDKIAAIMHTALDKIVLNFINVQRQSGSCDWSFCYSIRHCLSI